MARRYTRQARCPNDGQFISTRVQTEEEAYQAERDRLDGHYCEDVRTCRERNGRYQSCRSYRAARP
jgi:hypothetical protein